jgi:ribosomal protein S27E
MMDHLLTCKCGEVLVKSLDGTTKLRGKIVIFKGDQAYAVCKGCGSEHVVPVRLDRPAVQSLTRSPRLFVSGDRKNV